MIFSLLADAVLVIHGSFIVFAVFGAALAFRWISAPVLHLPALAWAAYIELSHGICPLTTLENALRHQAGEAGYSTSFVQHYLVPLVYPPGLSPGGQVWLAVALLAFNIVLYGCVVAARRSARRRAARHDQGAARSRQARRVG